MNRVRVPIGIHIIAILMVCAFFTGCVEVTPPTGEQNASAYGPVSQGSGDMKDLVKGQNQTTPVQTSGQSSQQGTLQILLRPKPCYLRLKMDHL